MYKILDHPRGYKVAQYLFAPGYRKSSVRNLETLLQNLPPARLLLDVGCGPESRLSAVSLQPIGVDRSRNYMREYRRKNRRAVVSPAETLPFPSQSFDGVWSFGLLHHLTNCSAAAAISEMTRVCKSGGYVIIYDAVLPRSILCRPVARVIRRLDRGKYVRRQEEIELLLPSREQWSVNRQTYSLTGLERVICRLLKK